MLDLGFPYCGAFYALQFCNCPAFTLMSLCCGFATTVHGLDWLCGLLKYISCATNLGPGKWVAEWNQIAALYSAMAGAITVATLALALTSGDSSHEHMVHCAITEAATKLISGIF
ncbi:hypothetical protein JHK85_046904 [Glycine max]|nr:hypothetical protein JHK86_046354 [Glycine max]KAG4942258.1 hypothetical protein JHK85_046904 [Glycine max]